MDVCIWRSVYPYNDVLLLFKLVLAYLNKHCLRDIILVPKIIPHSIFSDVFDVKLDTSAFAWPALSWIVLWIIVRQAVIVLVVIF